MIEGDGRTMANIRPFRGVRPAEHLVSQIAALPYDVYSSREARKVVEENPLSFLKIDRAETQFPEETDMYSQQVYDRARDTLVEMETSGQFVQDKEPCYYIYAQTMGKRTQTGLVCAVSIDDYLENVVKRHENTREDKELDRIRHVDTCSAHTGPIFLAYRGRREVKEVIETVEKERALYDFVSDDGVRHQVWKIEACGQREKMTAILAEIDSLYIADGHHRAASAVKVGLMRRHENPGYDGTEEFNYFLAVLFPAEELRIYDYNRVIHKLREGVAEHLPEELEPYFTVTKYSEKTIEEAGTEGVRPSEKGEISMYLKGQWYRLKAKKEICPDDPVEGLDVSVLQNVVLGPMLGISDPKTDERIQFVGGIRGLAELMRIVDREEHAVAFAMYPTSMGELMEVADAGRLMPPKSTWFEPKLRSGLLIHKF